MKNYLLLLILMISSTIYSQEILDREKVFNNAEVDEKPTFKGGMEKFYKYIAKNFKVPEEEGLKGKIIVESQTHDFTGIGLAFCTIVNHSEI